MKLWLILRPDAPDYDQYDSAVVAAETEEDARNTHPGGEMYAHESAKDSMYRVWTSPDQVKVEYLGEAKPDTVSGVICASFNAG